MILKNILSKLYPKVYVGIISSSVSTVVCIELYKKDKLIESQTKIFTGQEIAQKLLDFITPFKKESPFFYISLLDNATSQGVLFECDKEDKQSVTNTVSKVCHGSWSSYALTDELAELQQEYANVGVDFIFSPFTILSNIFSEKKTEDKAMLFVLLQEDLIVVSIFHLDKLLYGDIISMADVIEDEELDEIAEDDDTQTMQMQETFDLDDLDDLNLDDLSDLKDSESFDDLEDFAQTQDVSQEQKHDLTTSSNDYKRFLIIQNTLHNFYSNSKYASEFVETAYVASFCKLENDFKQYIEDELFLTVYVRSVELCCEVISLAKEESL